MNEQVASGGYARKQIFCPDPVVAWSHGSRFALAARLAGEQRGGRLLDFGCGDGTFIALTHGTFATAVGVDTDDAQIEDCRRRLANLESASFMPVSALDRAEHRAPFDVVTCMEVLEHCVDEERRRVLERLASLCRPDGRIIISVPIEVGPALAGKQFFRALAAMRGLGDYRHRETYTARELLRAVLARPHLARAEYLAGRAGGGQRYCGHKGFDWRILEREIRERLRLERRLFSPMPVLGRVMNSQVWFVCAPNG